MGMTVKEAILALNANAVIACERARFSSATVKMIEDALDTIEDALHAQEPRVMTLDEVKQHNNQYGCVWFELLTYNAVAAFAIQDEECTEIISPYILGEPINHGCWPNSNYNVTWRCWTSRPTEEQREAVPWN